MEGERVMEGGSAMKEESVMEGGGIRREVEGRGLW